MTPPPSHVVSRRAAIEALFTVSYQEARGLWAIVESSQSSGEAKQKALDDLAGLSSSTVVRLAQIQKAYEAKAEGVQGPFALERVPDARYLLDSDDEPKAA
jgi:hypothetical protein